MSSSRPGAWKEMLKAQYKDLESLEAMDAELNINQQAITANIDKILNRKSTSFRTSSSRHSRSHSAHEPMISSAQSASIDGETFPPSYDDGNTSKSKFHDANDLDEIMPPTSPEIRNRAISSPVEADLPKAPETQARYFKAKVKMLEKQVEDSLEARKSLNNQVTELQKSLKLEKDETKQLKKRIALLEADSRRQGKKADASAVSGTSDQLEQLTQEVTQLRKDIQTAERIAKQNDQSEKSKDTQLKRAVETISRLKAQVSELQLSTQQNGAPVDRTVFEATEQKVKVLEKQKAELINAFKKQMRLIDILKRQKAHLEASKLLSFTEEEFMETLDWAA